MSQQDGITIFYILQWLHEQKKAIAAEGVELHVSIELTNSQWLLAEVIKILQVYEEATYAASGDYATVSFVIPIVNSILRSLEAVDAKADHGVIQMKREMLSSLKSHYNNMESNKYYPLPTLLDP